MYVMLLEQTNFATSTHRHHSFSRCHSSDNDRLSLNKHFHRNKTRGITAHHSYHGTTSTGGGNQASNENPNFSHKKNRKKEFNKMQSEDRGTVPADESAIVPENDTKTVEEIEENIDVEMGKNEFKKQISKLEEIEMSLQSVANCSEFADQTLVKKRIKFKDANEIGSSFKTLKAQIELFSTLRQKNFGHRRALKVSSYPYLEHLYLHAITRMNHIQLCKVCNESNSFKLLIF